MRWIGQNEWLRAIWNSENARWKGSTAYFRLILFLNSSSWCDCNKQAMSRHLSHQKWMAKSDRSKTRKFKFRLFWTCFPWACREFYADSESEIRTSNFEKMSGWEPSKKIEVRQNFDLPIYENMTRRKIVRGFRISNQNRKLPRGTPPSGQSTSWNFTFFGRISNWVRTTKARHLSRPTSRQKKICDFGISLRSVETSCRGKQKTLFKILTRTWIALGAEKSAIEVSI